ncbi:exo-alpha-sialidase [Streptomyces sp. NPDC002513]
MQQQVLFQAGTGGYGCYRIPALVRTKGGSLLAFAEGRKAPSCGDRGDIDIVERRSTNDGRTWGPIKVVPSGATALGAYGTGPVPTGVQAGSPVTRGNAAPVVDLIHGIVYLVSTSNPVNSSYPRIPWVQESKDDGLTWSRPAKMNVALDPAATSSDWFATGPGHGVQLTGGPHPGRLVVGAVQKSSSGKDYAGYLYMDPNDNDTATWQALQAVDSSASASPTTPAEVSVTEVSGGSVYAAARNEGGTQRVSATIPTPAGTAVPSAPAFTTSSLPSPGDIQGSVLTLHPGDSTHTQEVLLSAPAGVDAGGKPTRTNMTVWSQCGTTWNAGKLISGGRAGYSDLELLASNEIGLLYEGGATYSADEIRFTRFTQAQLGTGCNTPDPSTSVQTAPDPGPTTPDATAQANDGYLEGNAGMVVGQLSGTSDKGLHLDGTGDYVDIPYARSLDTGSGDFTYSMWFKYTATSTDPDRVLFWSYGVGTSKPEVWLRTQPSQNRIYAWVQGSTGTATTALQDSGCGCAFGDNTWHFVSLTRSGGQISLQVTGAPSPAVASGVAGNVADTPANPPSPTPQ